MSDLQYLLRLAIVAGYLYDYSGNTDVCLYSLLLSLIFDIKYSIKLLNMTTLTLTLIL